MSKLKPARLQESGQLDVNLRDALTSDGMVLRHVAAKRVWRHKYQLQTNRGRTRIQHLKASMIDNPLLTAWKDRLNDFNRLVQDSHKGQWDITVAKQSANAPRKGASPHIPSLRTGNPANDVRQVQSRAFQIHAAFFRPRVKAASLIGSRIVGADTPAPTAKPPGIPQDARKPVRFPAQLATASFRAPICPKRASTSRASVRASWTAFSRSRARPSVRLAMAPLSFR